MTTPKIIHLDEDPNDSWARVELYRWQFGELPMHSNERGSFNIADAMRKMANAIERGVPSNRPSPCNIASVLRYAAKLVKQ